MPKKLNKTKLVQYVKAGLSVRDIADKMGFPKSTVSYHVNRLKKDITQGVITKPDIKKVINHEINAFQQLSKINNNANEMLDSLMKWQRGDKEALQILESQVREIRVGDSTEFVKEYKMKDPRELALRCMSEIRNQLDMQLKIMQALFDIKAAAEFQQEVIAAIGAAAPDVRDRILAELEKKRAIRAVVKIPE